VFPLSPRLEPIAFEGGVSLKVCKSCMTVRKARETYLSTESQLRVIKFTYLRRLPISLF